MKNKTLGLGALALTLGIVGVSAGTALAYRGDPTVKGPNYSAERHEAMEKAFENKDYEAWKNLMQGKGRVSEIVTEENFAKFAEVHELMEQGKTDEAKKLRQELGFGMHNGHGGHGKARGMGREMNR